MRPRALLGARGEQLVAARLRAAGYEIVGCNVQVGRLELDVIARRGDLTVFCEVRSRASRAFVDPIDTIDPRKQARIRAAAERWLARHGQTRNGQTRNGQTEEVRFDAASVVLNEDEQTVTYYEDAF